jgi:hypothetical protein
MDKSKDGLGLILFKKCNAVPSSGAIQVAT